MVGWRGAAGIFSAQSEGLRGGGGVAFFVRERTTSVRDVSRPPPNIGGSPEAAFCSPRCGEGPHKTYGSTIGHLLGGAGYRRA